MVSSTTSPTGLRDLAAELTQRTGGSLRVVDAPVSGGVEGAREGSLAIMVGGAAQDVDPVLPVLATMGRPVHLGPLGAGQVAKAANQVIVAAEVVALAEASLLAERAGLDVAAMFDLLGGGYAASRILEVKKQKFVDHDHTVAGAARYMVKDLTAAQEEAESTHTSTPLAAVLLELFAGLTEAGLGDLDTTVVQEYLAGGPTP